VEILEPKGQRLDLALDRLRGGESSTFNGAGFWLDPDNHIEAHKQSSWLAENVNEQTALNDMQVAERVMSGLIKESPGFAAIIKDGPKQIVLINDYGAGAVELWRLTEGSLKWAAGMAMAKNAV
jgi:hypothetical protein